MKRLPNIDDLKFLAAIDRMQYDTNTRDFFRWLFGSAREHVVNKMSAAKEESEMRNYQGVLQVLTDLKDLFAEAKAINDNL